MSTARKFKLRFGLRSFLVFIGLISVLLAYFKVTADKQAAIVAEVLDLGGEVHYDFQCDESGKVDPAGKSAVPQFLLNSLGVDFFHDVTRLRLHNITKTGYLIEMEGSIHRMVDWENRGFSKRRYDEEAMRNVVSGIATLESLQYLNMPPVDDMDGVFIDAVSKLKDLKHLIVLENCDLTDEGFSSLESLKKLKTVSIVRSEIGDESLAVAGKLKELKTLYLSGHVFSDEGVKNLSELENLHTLVIDGPAPAEKISLVSWFVGAESEPAKVESTISDQGMEYLSKLTGLKMFSVRHTLVTDEFREQFIAKYPKSRMEGFISKKPKVKNEDAAQEIEDGK